MADEQVRVIAQFNVKPEHVEQFQRRALAEMVGPTQGEPGCISYDLWQDRNEPTRFAMVEVWMSQADLDRHLALPSLHATLRELMPLGDGTLQTGFFRLLGGEK
jgi:quinol monooxygenase YgiN